MAEKGLTRSDLHGDLVDTVLIGTQQTNRRDETMMLLDLLAEDKQYKVGVIGEKAIDSLLTHGTKTDDGKVHLKVPRKILNEKYIGWLNFTY